MHGCTHSERREATRRPTRADGDHGQRRPRGEKAVPSGQTGTGRGPRERRRRKAQLLGPRRPSTGAVGRGRRAAAGMGTVSSGDHGSRNLCLRGGGAPGELSEGGRGGRHSFRGRGGRCGRGRGCAGSALVNRHRRVVVVVCVGLRSYFGSTRLATPQKISSKRRLLQ